MIDIHCHLDHIRLRPFVSDYISDPRISRLISCGIDFSSWKKNVELQNKLKVSISLGLHPFFASDDNNAELDFLEKRVDSNNICAIGEIGLDYYKDYSDTQLFQKENFIRQLRIAQKNKLPVIIHCRKAYADLFKLLDLHPVEAVILHSFSGSEQDLKIALDRDYYISIGLPITYEKNRKQKDFLHNIPINQLVFETDSPYMKNSKFKYSSPFDIVNVYNSAANILEYDVDNLILVIRENIKKIWSNLIE